MAALATVEIKVADIKVMQRLISAASELASTAEECASSLEASQNLETPRYVADELRDSVKDFRAALGA